MAVIKFHFLYVIKEALLKRKDFHKFYIFRGKNTILEGKPLVLTARSV